MRGEGSLGSTNGGGGGGGGGGGARRPQFPLELSDGNWFMRL